MKLFVGLGNPGPEYEKTRHNAGFMALDRLWSLKGDPSARPKARFSGITSEMQFGGERCVLLKPTLFMNLSGRSVAEAIGFFKLDPRKDLLVLVDDVAIPTGTVRLRAAGGAGGHNGLRDIERALSSQEYPRLRIGVDACPPMMKLEDYVLGRFTSEQLTLLAPALDRAVEAMEVFARTGIEAAMNRFNSPDAPQSKPKPAERNDAARKPSPTQTNPQTEVRKEDMHPGWLGRPGKQGEER